MPTRTIALLVSFVFNSLAAAEVAARPGWLVDDSQANVSPGWKKSTSVRPFIGDGYQASLVNADETVRYTFQLPQAGNYAVLVSYSASSNRAKNATYMVKSADGEKRVEVDQRTPGKGPDGFYPLGEFSLGAGETTITLGTKNANGAVIADAVWILTAEQFAAVKQKGTKFGKDALASSSPTPDKKLTPPAPTKTKPKATDKPSEPAPAPVASVKFEKQTPSQPKTKLTPAGLDALLEKEVGGIVSAKLLSDELFLRRASLDIIGRQPTTGEMDAFAKNSDPNKRAAEIERLLADDEYGRNWANYWSDVISYRVPQPELTFLRYQTLKDWLAAELNAGRTWDEVAHQVITASGKVGSNPAATFVGFHQADRSRLAAETSRIFLGTNISCAECHDHPFIDMPQSTFHRVAAFFVRTSAKMAQNNSDGIEVSSKPAGEHKMPGKGGEMTPAFFDSKPVELGTGDVERRTELARWVTSPDNSLFAKAYANRIWARLMGRGFCEPVDEIGEESTPVLAAVHAAVADHFAASQFDSRELIRLIANSRAYQRGLSADPEDGDDKDDERPFAQAVAGKLRGDEIFDSLVAAIELPNITPPQEKATGAVRFPPPPKTTRDLVNDAFGFDPSMSAEFKTRTMAQAMFMMNNKQIQAQVAAGGDAATMLAKLLSEEKDDIAAVKKLYQRVLARQPRDKELTIFTKHRASVADRQAAFEDLLWSLLNSAEFTTRR